MSYKIKSIEIEGFRGFLKKQRLDFDETLVLIHGGNHQGKSSVLNALEWCLYGDNCIGQKSGIRERVGSGKCSWRTINDNSGSAIVKLYLESKNENITISRNEKKGGGKKGKKLNILYEKGKELWDKEAEAEILKIFNISFRDFSTSVYQHQENIRDFIIQKSSDRSDAIDRLLGLSDYRNMLEGIRKSDVMKIQKEIVEKFGDFQTRIEEARKIREEDIKEKENLALEKGASKDDLNEEGLKKMSGIITQDIEKFAKNLGLVIANDLILKEWKGADNFISNSKEEIDRLWSESPDIKNQSEENQKIEELNSLKIKYEGQEYSHQTAKEELNNFIKKNGSLGGIKKKINKKLEYLNDIGLKIKEINPKAEILIEGINFLEQNTKKNTDECPLCGRKTSDLLNILREKYNKDIRVQIKKSEEKRDKLSEELSNLNALKDECKDLNDTIEGGKEKIDNLVNDISSSLNIEISGKEDPLTILTIELNEIEERLRDISNAIKNKRKKIDKISNKIKILDIVYQVILLQNKLEKIVEIEKTEEFKEQEDIRDAISDYVNNIDEIAKNLKKQLQKEAKEKVRSAKSKIDEYFKKITQNAGIKKIDLKVSENKTTGFNNYSFEDQNGNDPIPILSQGDLNSLAISIFLGLANALKDTSIIDFILMDDPSQSLDSKEKKNMIKVINEFCLDKDIIISTMDEEFRDLLKNNVTKAKTIYYFKEWSPISGPNISLEN